MCPQGLGDSLLATPMLKALHRSAADASVDVLVMRPEARELFEGLRPLVKKVLYLPYWEKGPIRFLLSIATLPFRRRYDVIFLSYPAARAEYHMLSGLVRARTKFAHRYFAPTLTNLLWVYDALVQVEEKHSVFRNLDLLAAAGVPTVQPVEYLVPPAWIDKNRLNGNRICFHIGTIAHNGLEARRWPESNFSEVARRMIARGFDVTFIAGPAEEKVTKRAADSVHGSSIFKGRLPDCARLISASRAVIANDNGIAHLAAAVGTPVLALFGPTPVEHGPIGERARSFRPSSCPPCFDPRRTNMKCVRNIDYRCVKLDMSVGQVEEQLATLCAN